MARDNVRKNSSVPRINLRLELEMHWLISNQHARDLPREVRSAFQLER